MATGVVLVISLSVPETKAASASPRLPREFLYSARCRSRCGSGVSVWGYSERAKLTMSPNADHKREFVVVILPVQYSAIGTLSA
jgi:hypothetical protein